MLTDGIEDVLILNSKGKVLVSSLSSKRTPITKLNFFLIYVIQLIVGIVCRGANVVRRKCCVANVGRAKVCSANVAEPNLSIEI